MSSFPLFWQWNSNKLQKFKTALSTEIISAMHRPGIEPGSIVWQATILPLNHRCLIYTILIVWTKFCSSTQFFFRNFEQNHENFVSFQLRFRIQLIIWVIFLFYDSGTVKNWKNVKLHFSRKSFLLFCFASPGNRTMVYCVEGDNATAEPSMLDFYLF